MSNEELLKPRYKVIADYPGCEYKVGDILLPDITIANDGVNLSYYTDNYKLLSWWEERKPEEMPEYVKVIEGFRLKEGMILPAKWDVIYDNEIMFMGNDGNNFWVSPEYFIPATETEYLNYINSK